MATTNQTPTGLQTQAQANGENPSGVPDPNDLSKVSTYRETRLNLQGVIKGRTQKQKNEQGVETEVFVPDVVTNKETGQEEYATEDLNYVVEDSKAHKEILANHAKLGVPEPTITKHQTFEYSEIKDPQQIVPYFESLGLSHEQAVKSGASIFQRGWAIAQQAEIRQFMTDAEQAEIEGVTSVAQSAAQPGERKQKDPMAAAAANLKKAGFDLSADQLRAFLATMQTAG